MDEESERWQMLEGKIPLVPTDGSICWGTGWIKPGTIVIRQYVNGEYHNDIRIKIEDDFVIAYFPPKERE